MEILEKGRPFAQNRRGWRATRDSFCLKSHEQNPSGGPTGKPRKGCVFQLKAGPSWKTEQALGYQRNWAIAAEIRVCVARNALCRAVSGTRPWSRALKSSSWGAAPRQPRRKRLAKSGRAVSLLLGVVPRTNSKDRGGQNAGKRDARVAILANRNHSAVAASIRPEAPSSC